MQILRKLLLVSAATLCVSTVLADNAPTLKTDRDKLSYSLGVFTGRTFRTHGVDIDPSVFAQGFQASLRGQKTLLTDQQMKQIVQQFQVKNQQAAASKAKKQSVINLAAGKKFLSSLQGQKGVVTTKTGLKYKILTKGTGPQPSASDSVTVDYEGRLTNGKVFDSSYKRGQPASFPVSGVIKGWQQALPMMHVGSTWELYVPANLAYGESDVPGIGPNQVLIFKVHLISIKKK